MSDLLNRFCSSCYNQGTHKLDQRNYIRRNVYVCEHCEAKTLECVTLGCSHMARTGKHWDENLCAEHDGSIASFESLGLQLEDIADFETIFERHSTDMLRVAKISAGVVAGVAVLVPVALVAAPGVASALGAAGFLGAAGTGTAIASLNGAALASASLAAVGGGTMAAGTAVVAAVGAALGGHTGGIVSNAYFGKIDHFDIRKIRTGNRHAVIFVNGFLSQGEHDVEEWTTHLDSHFPRNAWYHMDWEASALHDLGNKLAASPSIAGAAMAASIAKQALKAGKKGAGPFALVPNLADLLRNPWHISMVKAMMSGAMLADAIARTKGWRFTLVGHSLGARVIHYALWLLATKNTRRIEDVYLLGGAVGGGQKDDEDWMKAESAVKGTIYNCYSKNDDVLFYLYKGANGWRSDPIGYSEIHYKSDKIVNFNCTEFVGGHTKWKEHFGEIMTRLDDRREAA